MKKTFNLDTGFELHTSYFNDISYLVVILILVATLTETLTE